MAFDRELFNALRKGPKALSESAWIVVRSIWSDIRLPKKDGRKALGWVLLRLLARSQTGSIAHNPNPGTGQAASHFRVGYR
jgi:hypothetical protein